MGLLNETIPPYHERRFDIAASLERLPLRDGDILFRNSDAKGPLGLPFSRIVSILTRSPFTHSAVVIMRCDGPCVVEISSDGMTERRLIDWIDTIVDDHFRVYRLKDWTPEISARLAAEIDKVVDQDPDYDYTFGDPSRTYCTRCVCLIYEAAGFKILEPKPMGDILSPPLYAAARLGNAAYRAVTGCGMDMSKSFYWVGNERTGMMASPLIEPIYTLEA
jgi:hypothetical protein